VAGVGDTIQYRAVVSDSIQYVPDTTNLSQWRGSLFVNSSRDTMGFYDGNKWQLFFGGGGGAADTLYVAADSGSPIELTNGETHTQAGGFGLNTSNSSNTTTFTVDSTEVATLSALQDTSAAIRGDFPADTDNQTVDTLALSGTTLRLALEDDGEAPYEVDLSSLQDGTGMETWIIAGDTGSSIISDGATVTIAGGNGITTAESGGTLTVTAADVSATNELDTLTFSADSGSDNSLSNGGTLDIAGGFGVTTTGSAGQITVDADSSDVATLYALIDTATAIRNDFPGAGGSGFGIDSTVISGTAGSVLFVDASGNLQQDNSNLFWDDSNTRLGILDNTPDYTLDIEGTGSVKLPAGTTATRPDSSTIGQFRMNTTRGFPEFMGYGTWKILGAYVNDDVSKLIAGGYDFNINQSLVGLDGYVMTYNESNDEWEAQAASSGGAFSTTSNVTSNSPGTLSTDDFVFGADQLDDAGNSNHDYRFQFDKSKGAFRAGVATATQWDVDSVGFFSIALGYDNQAMSTYSGVLSGSTNYVGTASTVALITGGASNEVSGSSPYGVISGGNQGLINSDADYAHILGGRRGRAYNAGQLVYPGAWPLGDVTRVTQTSSYVVGEESTGTSNFELYLNTSNEQIELPNNTFVSGTAYCTAYIKTVGNGTNISQYDHAQQVIHFNFRNISGSVLGSSTTALETEDADMSDGTFAVSTDPVTDAIYFRYTPPSNAGTTTVIVASCSCIMHENSTEQ